MKIKNFINSHLENLLLKLISPLIKEEIKKETKEISDAVEAIEKKLTPEKVQQVLDSKLFVFKEKGLNIRVEKSYPNEKDNKVFLTSLPCWKKGRPGFTVSAPYSEYIRYDFNQRNTDGYSEKATESCNRFLEKIFETNCVVKIVSENAFEFVIRKPGSLTWGEVIPRINEAIVSNFPDIPGEEE